MNIEYAQIDMMNDWQGFWAKLIAQDKVHPERYAFIEQDYGPANEEFDIDFFDVELGDGERSIYDNNDILYLWAREVNNNPNVPLFTLPALGAGGLSAATPEIKKSPTIVWINVTEQGEYTFFYGSEIIKPFRVTHDLVPRQNIDASGDTPVDHPYLKGAFLDTNQNAVFEDTNHTRFYPVKTLGNVENLSYSVQEGICFGGGPTSFGNANHGWAKWNSSYIAYDPTGNTTGCYEIICTDASMLARAHLISGAIEQGQEKPVALQLPTKNGWENTSYNVYLYNASEKDLTSGNYYSIHYDRVNNLWLPINSDSVDSGILRLSFNDACPTGSNNIWAGDDGDFTTTDLVVGPCLELLRRTGEAPAVSGIATIGVKFPVNMDTTTKYTRAGLTFVDGVFTENTVQAGGGGVEEGCLNSLIVDLEDQSGGISSELGGGPSYIMTVVVSTTPSYRNITFNSRGIITAVSNEF